MNSIVSAAQAGRWLDQIAGRADDDADAIEDLCRAVIAQAAELTLLRARVAAADKLAEAVSGLIAILDRNDTKGPIPDIEMMFCWMAAQSVRAAVAGFNTK